VNVGSQDRAGAGAHDAAKELSVIGTVTQ
jgi:hypothetical protein